MPPERRRWISLVILAAPLWLAASSGTKTQRAKPHVSVMVLGEQVAGERLVSAILGHRTVDSVAFEYSSRQTSGLGTSKTIVEHETESRGYAIVLPETDAGRAQYLIAEGDSLGGVLLMVRGRLSDRVREHLRLARELGVPRVVTFLDNVTPVEAARVGQALAVSGYPEAKAKTIAGSVDEDPSIDKLWRTMDDHLEPAARPLDRPFLMPIGDVFSIAGKGTVVAGRIERGVVKLGDEVEIVGWGRQATRRVTGIEMFRKSLDRGQAGDEVGVSLRATRREELERGQVLAAPGSIAPVKSFRALIYLLTAEEAGRSKAIVSGYRPQIYLRNVDVSGTVGLPSGVEEVDPGEIARVAIELEVPVAVEKGLRFAIREGGTTVGAGAVTLVGEGDDEVESWP